MRSSVELTVFILLILSFMSISVTSVQAGNWFSNIFDRGVKGSGDIITDKRDVKPFDKIKTSGSYDVNVTVGESQSLEVIFDDNLVDLIETKVRGGTLYIGSEESYRSKKSCRIEITVPELRGIISSGSSDIIVNNIKGDFFEINLRGSGDVIVDGVVDEMEIDLAGSGDIRAEGETEVLDVTLAGSGDINARHLVAQDVEVTIRGSGDVTVNAKNSFDGSIYGSGDIDCYGHPKDISNHVTGSGDISMK